MQYQLHHQAATLPQLSTLPTPPPLQAWTPKAATVRLVKLGTTRLVEISTAAVWTKQNPTIISKRDNSILFDTTNPLIIYDAFDSAIKKPLIPRIEFTTNHDVLFLTKYDTCATSVLEAPCSASDEAIKATIPAAFGLTKDEIWYKVILHGVPTSSTFNTIESEIEEFNPGTHFLHPPRWFTTIAQCQENEASAIVLTIGGKDSHDKALRRGLLLLRRKHRGRRSIGANPFAALFNPPIPPPNPASSEYTYMEVNPGSPVQTVPAPASTTSAEEYPSIAIFPQRHFAEGIYNPNLGFTIRTKHLEEAFQALQEHLIVVQNRHITDIQILQNQVAHLTFQVEYLQYQLHHQQPLPPQQTTLCAPLQQQTWGPRAARAVSGKSSTILTAKTSTLAQPLTIRDAINHAIKKPLIAGIEFTTNHHVLLLTKDNIPATSVLKVHQSAIEEAIRATIPAAMGLRNDEIWYKVIPHGISTSSTCSTIEYEIEEFNPGAQLPHPTRWLTTSAQRAEKEVSAMVLAIAGKDSTDKTLSRGHSLLGQKFKV
ncbi:hypothetical protein HOY80DRAFT_1031342 [Tuber brumale]|nr:hypothetical protein HOY80DRAFT_1031342 [Tuber brumale]